MSDQWMYSVDGVQYGPVTRRDLQRFLALGQLEPGDHVWTEGMPAWVEARQISALADGGAPLFSVGNPKLLIMYFGTFGGYQVYWMYKQWTAIRRRTREDMWPIARAIFAIFFFHKLIHEVNAAGRERGFVERLRVAPLTTLFVLPSILWRLPDPYWLITLFGVIAPMIVQRRVNEINRSAVGLVVAANHHIHGWNWLAVFLGLPFFARAVWLTFFPEG